MILSHDTLAGKRVLVAEDSRLTRILFANYLASAGVLVVEAEDGRQAVARAAAEPFDAILMDLQMPELDGDAAAALLRQNGYGGPILMLTAADQPEDEARCLRAGCDACLGKGIRRPELLAALARHLGCEVPAGAEASLEKLTRQFVRGLPGRVEELQAAAAADDRNGTARLAHRLRGAAAMYGFAGVAETAALLESAAREGQEGALLHELLGELEAEMKHFQP